MLMAHCGPILEIKDKGTLPSGGKSDSKQEDHLLYTPRTEEPLATSVLE